MATAPVTAPPRATPPDAPVDTRFFGHPRGLATLFFTEFWERFSYYGMRAILILFMTAPLAIGGLGFDTAKAGVVYGTYTSLVYLTALPGGWLADRFLGQRRATLYGGVVIMLGHICLAVPTHRHLLSRAAVSSSSGTGLLKPNVSTMVGELYGPDDARRDAGFSIFYMGINLGAFLSPLDLRLAGAERPVPRDSRLGRHPARVVVALGLRRGGGRHVLRYRPVSRRAGSTSATRA